MLVVHARSLSFPGSFVTTGGTTGTSAVRDATATTVRPQADPRATAQNAARDVGALLLSRARPQQSPMQVGAMAVWASGLRRVLCDTY